MTTIRDAAVIKHLFQDQLIGKQILQIDTESVWKNSDGEWYLENVTSIHIEGGLVLCLSGSARIDDSRVDVLLSRDLETRRDNSDGIEYPRIWIN
jgi:hypothetical protein